jgi:hypothetical protein
MAQYHQLSIRTEGFKRENTLKFKQITLILGYIEARNLCQLLIRTMFNLLNPVQKTTTVLEGMPA